MLNIQFLGFAVLHSFEDLTPFQFDNHLRLTVQSIPVANPLIVFFQRRSAPDHIRELMLSSSCAKRRPACNMPPSTDGKKPTSLPRK